ncbi:MAG: hypothetical protein ABI772_04985 [Bacteroidota bacterium]
MKDNIKISGCLTEEQLLLYIKNELSASEQREAELHLTDCELCSDALEGLKLIKNNDHTTALLKDLKHQVNKKLEGKVKSLPVSSFWWQIAAILFVLFLGAGGYFYVQHLTKSNIVSQKQEEKNSTPALPSTPQPEINSDQNIPDDKKQEFYKTQPVPPVTEIKSADAADEAATSSNENFADRRETEAINPDQDASKKTAMEPQTDFSTNVNTSPAAKTTDEENAIIIKEKVPTDNTVNGNKPEAGESAKFDDVTISEKRAKNISSGKEAETDFNLANKNYKAGEAYYKNKEFDNALKYFKLVIDNGKSDFYYDALWYSAEIKISKNQKAIAKAYLKILQSDSPKYKQQATKLLENL